MNNWAVKKHQDILMVRNLSCTDLEKISAIWAIEEEEMHTLGSMEIRASSTIKWLKLDALLKTLDFSDVSPTNFLYEHAKSDHKYSKLILKWMNKEPIDCPALRLDNEGELFVVDGRHRIIAASKIGEVTIPVMISPKSVSDRQLSKWI